MRFAAAAAALFHGAAMTVAHGASPAHSGLGGQRQDEVEHAEKNKHGKRNYFLVTPLHS
jgi:hypothetical protein